MNTWVWQWILSFRMKNNTRHLDGETVVFQLPGYASKKEKNERFFSSPFYTHPQGYKMCVVVNGNGEGEGAHVSVFIMLFEGRYDNQLHWPILGTVIFELLNSWLMTST